MMTKRAILAIFVLLLTASAGFISPAVAVPVTESSETPNSPAGNMPLTVSPRSISVSLWYKGNEVTVSGRAPADADSIVAILRSMETPHVTVARKGRVVLFWMAVKKFKVEQIPGVYQIATSMPLRQIREKLSPEDVLVNQIGYEALRQGWKVERISGTESADDMDVLFNGIVKLKENSGLYRVEENGVRLQPDGSFSIAFPVSDATTVGKYAVLAYALKDGKITGRGQDELAVVKIGLINWLTNMAGGHAGAYGVIAVVIAFCTGIIVSFIFKGKGGH